MQESQLGSTPCTCFEGPVSFGGLIEAPPMPFLRQMRSAAWKYTTERGDSQHRNATYRRHHSHLVSVGFRTPCMYSLDRMKPGSVQASIVVMTILMRSLVRFDGVRSSTPIWYSRKLSNTWAGAMQEHALEPGDAMNAFSVQIGCSISNIGSKQS